MKICVLIPSYNEAQTIESLVERIKNQDLDVVVVDDGSVDQTAMKAKHSGAYVLTQQKNQGKGASLKAGFRYILNKDYDAVITMDGDNQHSPDDIPRLITAAADPEADMIVGNRMAACQNMPFIRWATNSFMSFLISLICRQKIYDSQCGFRLIKRRLLAKLNLISANYEIETEAIIEAIHKGFRIKFVPVQTIYDRQKSQINPIIDAIRFFVFMLRIFFPILFNK